MNLPIIVECDAGECAYNANNQCHAAAITIGDGITPNCDTFFAASQKGGIANIRGEVGACRVSACRHNKMLECTASGGVHMGHHGSEVDCLTYMAS